MPGKQFMITQVPFNLLKRHTFLEELREELVIQSLAHFMSLLSGHKNVAIMVLWQTLYEEKTIFEDYRPEVNS